MLFLIAEIQNGTFFVIIPIKSKSLQAVVKNRVRSLILTFQFSSILFVKLKDLTPSLFSLYQHGD